MKKVALLLLAFYQKFLTVLLGYGSCRYYPTCSEYAKWQLENNNFFKALLLSILRVLRCNQLFRGGIEYPIVKKDFKIPSLQKKIDTNFIIKYWFVPKGDKAFYVIKSIEKLCKDVKKC